MAGQISQLGLGGPSAYLNIFADRVELPANFDHCHRPTAFHIGHVEAVSARDLRVGRLTCLVHVSSKFQDEVKILYSTYVLMTLHRLLDFVPSKESTTY